jgi:prepilin-type N-terminal cleavage/methylation domain-containing protein
VNLPRRDLARQSRRGFSLVELLAVITVIGLIAGVVAVDFVSSMPRAELNSTVHDIAAGVGGARSDSIARNGEFRIYYDMEANGYTVRSPFQLGGGLAQRDEDRAIVKRVLFPDSISIERVTIDGIPYTEGQVFVAFSPLGSATGHTITLRQSPTDMITTVEVLPLTGLIRFHYNEFEREVMTEENFD